MQKRKVIMTNYVLVPADDGPQMAKHEATDYVPVDILEAYVADAQTRWQYVNVGEEHDAGPGGEDGETVVPEHLTLDKTLQDHLAGGEN